MTNRFRIPVFTAVAALLSVTTMGAGLPASADARAVAPSSSVGVAAARGVMTLGTQRASVGDIVQVRITGLRTHTMYTVYSSERATADRKKAGAVSLGNLLARARSDSAGTVAAAFPISRGLWSKSYPVIRVNVEKTRGGQKASPSAWLTIDPKESRSATATVSLGAAWVRSADRVTAIATGLRPRTSYTVYVAKWLTAAGRPSDAGSGHLATLVRGITDATGRLSARFVAPTWAGGHLLVTIKKTRGGEATGASDWLAVNLASALPAGYGRL